MVRHQTRSVWNAALLSSESGATSPVLLLKPAPFPLLNLSQISRNDSVPNSSSALYPNIMLAQKNLNLAFFILLLLPVCLWPKWCQPSPSKQELRPPSAKLALPRAASVPSLGGQLQQPQPPNTEMVRPPLAPRVFKEFSFLDLCRISCFRILLHFVACSLCGGIAANKSRKEKAHNNTPLLPFASAPPSQLGPGSCGAIRSCTAGIFVQTIGLATHEKH